MFKLIFTLLCLTAVNVKADPCILVNDYSGLSETCMSAYVSPTTVDEFRQALALAKVHNWQVSPAGEQHSMNGQSIAPQGMLLSMKKFNRIVALDLIKKQITVQSGITWKDIQAVIDEKGLAIDVMQNVNIFSVGGSISVNAMGAGTHSSLLASNVVSMKVMLADGTIVMTSRTQNSELFSAVIGGYGLFGVILEATLQLRDNLVYKTKVSRLDYRDFPDFFEKNLARKSDNMMRAFLSISPRTYMKEMVVINYYPQEGGKSAAVPPIPQKGKIGQTMESIQEKIVNWCLNRGKSGNWNRMFAWFLESRVQTALLPGSQTRNQVMNEKFPDLAGPDETLTFQTFLIPKKYFVSFLDKLRERAQSMKVQDVLVSVLNLNQDETAMLSAASGGDQFGITLTLVNPKTMESDAHIKAFGKEITDEVIRLGGHIYLAHRIFYTPDQLRKIHPNVDAFFQLKTVYDPTNLFTNRFYQENIKASISSEELVP